MTLNYKTPEPVDPTASPTSILTPEAKSFVTKLARNYSQKREELLQRRARRQAEIDGGRMPDFLRETEHIRNDASWKVTETPSDLQYRWVEITGPASSRKMVINALNSGANAYMADAEDSESPTWDNIIQGQINLRDAVSGTLELKTAQKYYKPNEKTATLMFRPRGWHLVERHFLVDGKPVSASLFDFGLYFFHNVHSLIGKGSGPYFYLPKMESHLEARLWNDVLNFAEDELSVRRGTIKVTVLIETLPAAFEMEEILYELRSHIIAENGGRWDYISSTIKTLGQNPDFVFPDRSQLTMIKPFLEAYSDLIVKTCHKRGAHAIGGMAAQIPSRTDPTANAEAMEKIREDKIREVQAGYDGTWVAHPDLVPVVREIFEKHMPGPNQLNVLRGDVNVTNKDLLSIPNGAITEAGLKRNIDVGLKYLEAWLSGTGSVAIYGLMEDMATFEICRAQLWQWNKHKAGLNDGRKVNSELLHNVILEELGNIRKQVGEERFSSSKFDLAARLYEGTIKSEDFVKFMPLSAYEYL